MSLAALLAAGAVAVEGATGIGSMIANKKENQRNRDWQERMSNTAVQRRKEDLIAAGINPMFAADSAADVGSGASGLGSYQSTATSALSSYRQYKLEKKITDKQLVKMDAEVQNLNSQRDANSALKQKYVNDAKLQLQQINESIERSKNLNANTRLQETQIPKKSLFGKIWESIQDAYDELERNSAARDKFKPRDIGGDKTDKNERWDGVFRPGP